MNQVDALEKAILDRAEQLANEYRERGQRSRDTILRDAAERLRLREQREESIARELGERTYRQHVQASELKLQSHIDRVRWNLVTDVERRLAERFEAYTADESAYRVLIGRFIAEAGEEIESDELIAELNAHDLQRLGPRWDGLVAEYIPGKSVRLIDEPMATIGGVRVTSTDGRVRVDNTFEGRLERLSQSIQQMILEQLLPGGLDTSNAFGG